MSIVGLLCLLFALIAGLVLVLYALQRRDVRSMEDLSQQLQRTPTEDELARHLRVDVEDIRAARSADLGFSAWSLDAPLSDETEAGSLADLLGQEDPQMEHD